MKKKYLALRIIFVILLVASSIYFGYIMMNNNKNLSDNNKKETKQTIKDDDEETPPPPPPPPKLKIIDEDSDTRPIAIMIDNEKDAWPHAGLQDAFLIYEIIIEGGQTRFLAIYKDQETSMIGPNRSARHYFLDYALENDAIYTHFGFSTQASRDIPKLGINNISGTQSDGSAFWREKPLGGWHNVFTKISNLTSRAKSKGYRTTTDVEPLLNYSIEEIDLSSYENVKEAQNIRIDYSSAHYVEYKYDEDKQLYKRYMRGNPHVDRVTEEQYTFKNIIVYDVRNYPLNDGSGKGRQGLDNIGSGDGYYITNGYSIPIKWEKISRSAKTKYTDLEGNEIKINDGNTFINIQPLNKKMTIE